MFDKIKLWFRRRFCRHFYVIHKIENGKITYRCPKCNCLFH